MDPIYVTGHQNPDTDSIVAAIAYASLKNSLGKREYEMSASLQRAVLMRNYEGHLSSYGYRSLCPCAR